MVKSLSQIKDFKLYLNYTRYHQYSHKQQWILRSTITIELKWLLSRYIRLFLHQIVFVYKRQSQLIKLQFIPYVCLSVINEGSAGWIVFFFTKLIDVLSTFFVKSNFILTAIGRQQLRIRITIYPRNDCLIDNRKTLITIRQTAAVRPRILRRLELRRQKSSTVHCHNLKRIFRTIATEAFQSDGMPSSHIWWYTCRFQTQICI